MATETKRGQAGSSAGVKAGKRKPKRRLKDLPDKTLSSELATNVRGGELTSPEPTLKKHVSNIKWTAG
jgi:hypothetical protein